MKEAQEEAAPKKDDAPAGAGKKEEGAAKKDDAAHEPAGKKGDAKGDVKEEGGKGGEHPLSKGKILSLRQKLHYYRRVNNYMYSGKGNRYRLWLVLFMS